MADVRIHRARAPEDLEATRALFLEYAESLGFSLCFQGFDRELAELPGCYAPPDGEIFLATIDGALAGCGAVRPLDEGISEMKRLFVRPGFRGHQLGRRLAEAVVDHARQRGFSAMRLDTIETMTAAIALYQTLGFREIEPYYENPLPGVRYFELLLPAAR